MQVTRLRTNHIQDPLGFQLEPLRFSWITQDMDSKEQTFAQVQIARDSSFREILYDSQKKAGLDSCCFTPEITLQPRTRYYWRVQVWGDAGDSAISEIAWFETGKMEEAWQADWIAPDLSPDQHPLLRKQFSVKSAVVSARAYVCGFGLYELEINGQHVGDEYLAPGFNSYDYWQQYQTYDITSYLQAGDNVFGVMLGNGTYKGRYGFDGGYTNLYGDTFCLIAEIVLQLSNGSTQRIVTDSSWQSHSSPVQFSGIYDGEVYDAEGENSQWSCSGFDARSWQGTRVFSMDKAKLQPRRSLPIKIKQRISPIAVLHTPKGETVLDMGQNMTGWIMFHDRASKGQELLLEFGEVLQDQCFYRENLRTAKAAFCYVSRGEGAEVRPHFTYFGFRYVRLTGFSDVRKEDFVGCVLYSDLEETGFLETSNPEVNRLFQNAKWGQKGNFLDVPTDCPQRDERMGWTGDAQIFAATACYNMDTAAFYAKYMYDLHEEQKRLHGSVPFVVPMIKPKKPIGFVMGHGSTAWGDAAVIIPWTLYLYYGDKAMLSEQFEAMVDWVEYIHGIDEKSGGHRLWTEGFHFADWLALDGKNPADPNGGTDKYYVASAYYAYSAQIVSQAAKVLGKLELSHKYAVLAREIRKAIVNEYFTPTGRCSIPTQTALIAALYMDLVPLEYRQRLIDDLHGLLQENHMHLNTGFVGTAYFCRVLSENGRNEDAYQLLLNRDYPSWLYAVNLGATTIWERWNSVLPDGRISGTGMNSLNHYAYGSVAEWMYRDMCGICPLEDMPGFRHFRLSPKPYGRLMYAKAAFSSPCGRIESGWRIMDDGRLSFDFLVPFNTVAEAVLPDACRNTIEVNQIRLADSDIRSWQAGGQVVCSLTAGRYHFEYQPGKDYVLHYGIGDKLSYLLENKKIEQVLRENIPELFAQPMILEYGGEIPLKDIRPAEFGSDLDWSMKLPALDKELNKILQ